MYDLIGIGSGPAGLMGAIAVARHGLKVLMLKRMLKPGLYPAGEVFNPDGPCSGGRRQWAFSSGNFAGQKIERAVQ